MRGSFGGRSRRCLIVERLVEWRHGSLVLSFTPSEKAMTTKEATDNSMGENSSLAKMVVVRTELAGVAFLPPSSIAVVIGVRGEGGASTMSLTRAAVLGALVGIDGSHGFRWWPEISSVNGGRVVVDDEGSGATMLGVNRLIGISSWKVEEKQER